MSHPAGGGPPAGTVRATFDGADLWLLPERAAFDPAAGALVVADLHLGKAATFRRSGLPVPHGTTTDDLARLDVALERTGARRLWLLGDLLHARAGRASTTLAAVTEWRRRRADLEILLVRGNHDRAAGDPPAAWRMEVVAEPHVRRPWVLRHHPEPDSAGFVLAGHVHPAVTLRRPGERLRAACFLERAGVLVLPAFGAFTGSAQVRPEPGERVWAIGPDDVLEVPIAGVS